MKTQIQFPPLILQRYDSKLLSHPCPKFRDDSETLVKFYIAIQRLIAKKSRSGKWKAGKKIQQLIDQFEDLYESIKTKEKELEEKDGVKTKMPFYFITLANKNERDLQKRFKR